ncbi:glycosyltransferase family 25 protein [Hypomontagnella submonticulosa]|nr:glycosyltransferase family 25 protein [Hypomontagnella submonticulosa]
MLRPNWVNRNVIVAIILVVVVLGLLQSRYSSYTPLRSPHKVTTSQSTSSPRESAANSTLGFQKLLALSHKPSWRTRGLEAAANLTGLEFSIPPQPHNSEELIKAFQSIGADKEGAKQPASGSAKAWLSHLDLLKYVIASDFETVFIVEDDVDWDLRIKDQIRLVSDNVRAYTGVKEDDRTPYGTNWDVLWLGHCGSIITDDMPTPRVYPDDSRCETELYSGWSKRFLREKLTEGHRQVQASLMTVCTFGFGVTRQGARKIVPQLSRGADEAFDVALSAHCRDKKLNCVVVNPQLFNHYEPPADKGYISAVHVGDGQGEASSDSEFEHTKGTTGNIMKSARCEALFHDVCMRPPSEI